VRAQTLADWECIVVDDGSTDATARRTRGHGDARIRLYRQANQGVSAARNAGLALAEGAYVLFLDGDDRLHPRALQRLCAPLDARPDAVASYGTVWAIAEDGGAHPQKPLARRRFGSGDLLRPLLRGEVFFLMGSTLARTRDARALQGFRGDLRLSEDWEFWCRLAARGEFAFVGCEPEVSCVRIRPGSASRALATAWENHLPTIEAVSRNAALAARFGRDEWRRLTREMLAAHLFEAGRVNFTARRHAEARRLMLRALWRRPTAKRLALFALAQASQLVGVALAPRLRFLDQDAAR
jgi:glycosyltransferase involved in cell wall biosynthesis